MCCENIIAKIWGFTLFSGFYLLFMCMIFSNSSQGTIWHDLMIKFGIAGAVIIVVCITAVLWFKPLNKIVCGGENRQILQPILYHEPRAILAIANRSENKPIDKQMDPAIANYIQNNIHDSIPTYDIVIAESIHQV
jgi:hypothetical protein